MRTIKQLQRFYVVEVFRPQPPTPGSQGSETVSPPCGASAFNRGQYTTRVTVRASKGRALQLEHGLDFLSIQAYALWMEYPSREKDEKQQAIDIPWICSVSFDHGPGICEKRR